MKAVIVKEHMVASLVDIQEQKTLPDYIKVKTVALAVNPTDKDHCAAVGRVGGILGLDLSGIVEEVGVDCKSDVKKGDEVYGVSHGANLSSEEDGAFAEYALVRDGFVMQKPDNVTFEEAATLGVGVSSVGLALYLSPFKLPLPGTEPIKGAPFILINGGSSATGTLAIQYAKLSGLTVITTASPANFELVKSRGADAVFDYHDPECAHLIREHTNGELYYVLDCVSTEASYGFVAESLAETPAKPVHVVTLLPADNFPRKDVTVTTILAYTILGKPFNKFGMDFPAFPDHYEFGVMFWKLSQKLLAEGKVKPHPVALQPGGLAGILNGLVKHSKGSVRAAKLVYRVAETEDVQNHQVNLLDERDLSGKWL